MALNKQKTRFHPWSKSYNKVIAFIMLPLRYGSVLTNIIFITVLRLSVDRMVWVSTELFLNKAGFEFRIFCFCGQGHTITSRLLWLLVRWSKITLTLWFIIIILLQECASFYFWSPAEVPRMQGSAGFCSLVAIFHDLEHPTFANLWQSCHILVLLSTSFSVFLFLSLQLLRVVPLLDPFLHPFSPHVPTIATFSLSETLPI